MASPQPFARRVLLVEPASFGSNPETAASNEFQRAEGEGPELNALALGEIRALVKLLEGAGVECLVVQDRPAPRKPDAVFPNNIFATWPDGRATWFPMLSPLRRAERESLRSALESYAWDDSWLGHESKGRYLEGTGSLVLDQGARIAYAVRSPRTDENLVREWCNQEHFEPVIFDAVGPAGLEIYHTNVVMGVGPGFIGVGLDCIPSLDQRAHVRQAIQDSGREIFEFTPSQIASFAGNFLTLQNSRAEIAIVMSLTGWQSLQPDQHVFLQARARVLTPDLPTIEAYGGGSARCCLAELWASSA